MLLTTLASGSTGNSILISQGETHLLVDAGISCRKITSRLKEMNICPSKLTAILITHSHADHIGGLNILCKNLNTPVYATVPTCDEILRKGTNIQRSQLQTLVPDRPVCLGEITVHPFATPHDAPGSLGFVFSAEGRRACVATDLGYLPPNVLNALSHIDLALLEANYDPDWLRSGPYPYYLQERVMGSMGHLSNHLCGELAVRLAKEGTQRILLAHLSKENNTPARARETVEQMLTMAGCHQVLLDVVPRDQLSLSYQV